MDRLKSALSQQIERFAMRDHKKANDKKPDRNRANDKKAGDKKSDRNRAEDKKSGDKKPDRNRANDKKAGDRKPETAAFPVSPPGSPPTPPPPGGRVEAFLACARQALGGVYCTPAREPNCTDCSGLVRRCYRQATGQDITGDSHEQIKLGTPVSRSDVQPGDVPAAGGR